MKKMISLALGAVAVLALSGCNSTGNTDPVNDIDIKIDYVENTSIKPSKLSAIDLMNDARSYEKICHAYSTPHNSDQWYELNGMPIPQGQHRNWGSDACDQEWDIKVVDCAGHEVVGTYYRKCHTTTYFTSINR